MPRPIQAHCPILEKTVEVEPTVYSRDPWQIVRCRETGLIFLANPPEYEQLETEFAWEKTKSQERERRVREEPLLASVSSFYKWLKFKTRPNRCKVFELARAAVRGAPPKKQLRIVDIGCGWGELMDDLHQRFAAVGQKIAPCGIEVSKELAELSGERFERLGGRVVQANAVDGADQFEPGSIDIVIMRSFLEHERQPLTLLNKLRPALAVGGSIIVKVPNFNSLNRRLRGRKWCGFRYPDHVQYFTPRTLSLLADQAGYAVARQTLLDKPPLSDNMYAILQPAASIPASTPVRKAA